MFKFFILFGVILFNVSLFASDVSGIYKYAHQIQFFDIEKNDFVLYDTVDKVIVKQQSSDSIYAKIKTTGDNAHTCLFEGVLKKEDEGVYSFAQNLPDYFGQGGAPRCQLVLSFVGNKVEVADTDGNCKSFYCGMSARMAGEYTN